MNQFPDNAGQWETADYRRLSDKELNARLDALLSTPAAEQPLGEVQFLLHELHVHQIELEVQNRELREAQARLEESRDRYADLYDFAPVGYLTLDTEGKILNLNLTAAVMLGEKRAGLLGKPLVVKLAAKQSRILFGYLGDVFRSKTKVVRELRLNASLSNTQVVLIKGVASKDETTCNCAIIDITEQKQAEEALRAERDRAQGYLDTVEAVIVALDTKGRITLVNRKGCEMLGYSEDALIGKDWFTTCLPASAERDTVRSVFHELLTGITRHFEYFENPVQSHSGEEHMMAWHHSVLRDTQDNVVGILSAGEDITHHRQAEEDLRILHRAMDQSPAIVVITDVDGNTEYVNPAFSKITGYNAMEMQGKNPRILQSFVTPEEEFALLWEGVNKGTPWFGEHQNRKKNGEYYWESASVSPVRNANGIITHFLAEKEDITERKRVETAHETRRCLHEQLITGAPLEEVLAHMVKASEEFFQGTQCSIFTMDTERNCLHLVAAPSLHESFRSAFGVVEIGPEAGPCLDVATTGKPAFIEDIFSHPYWETRRELADNSCIRSCWAEPIVSSRHDILGIFTMYHREPRVPTATDRETLSDLAFLAGVALEHKQREEQDRQHESELARMARLSIMGEMATGIAHELNQPLSAISTYAGVALRMLNSGIKQPASMAEALEGARDQAIRASEIIRHVRQFVSKRPLQKEPVDINELIRQVLKFTQYDLRKLKIKVSLHLAKNLPPAGADRIQIEQVLVNILRNGIEAMQEAASTTRKITITTERSQHDVVQTTISDSGPGMENTLLSRIFDPFMTTKEETGMGVGLSICRSIIENHGGRLWAESHPDQGATFFFTLPASIAK